jgi:uncharacterized phage-associated protein
MKLIDTAKEKRINAILYFCKNTRRLSETKLYKLLYFLDFLHFKDVGRPVTDLEYFAWNFGPVPTKLFFEIKNKQAPKPILNCLVEERDSDSREKRATFFKSLQAPDLKVFSARERKILENVAFIFREATAKDMTEITHLKNEPWDRTLKLKGEKKKIDWFLALDSEAKIDRESAEERLQQSEEMKEIFGNG